MIFSDMPPLTIANSDPHVSEFVAGSPTASIYYDAQSVVETSAYASLTDADAASVVEPPTYDDAIAESGPVEKLEESSLELDLDPPKSGPSDAVAVAPAEETRPSSPAHEEDVPPAFTPGPIDLTPVVEKSLPALPTHEPEDVLPSFAALRLEALPPIEKLSADSSSLMSLLTTHDYIKLPVPISPTLSDLTKANTLANAKASGKEKKMRKGCSRERAKKEKGSCGERKKKDSSCGERKKGSCGEKEKRSSRGERKRGVSGKGEELVWKEEEALLW